MHLYRDPLLYDLVYRGATADQFASLRRISDALGLPAGGPWLETACGSARLLEAAAGAGITVAGFDLEPAMVDFARARLPASSEIHVADLVDCAAPFAGRTFPFAFTLVNTIRHLPDDDALLAHFRAMAALLAPTGRYVIGLSLARPGIDEIEEDVWRGGEGDLTVTELSTTLPAEPGSRSETIISHLTIERAGREPEHRTESFPLRTYTHEEWEQVVGRSALQAAEVFDLWGEPTTPFSGGYFLYSLSLRGEEAGVDR